MTAHPIDGFYGDDLAYIHDAGYGDVARDAAQCLVDELARAGHASGTIVDLGCGSGLLAHQVIEAGYSVIGIDASPAMVTLARMRAPRADFRVGTVVGAAIPTCVGVTAIGEVLNYRFDATNDASTRVDLFGRVYRALLPGGIFLFDMAGPERASLAGQQSLAVGADWAVLVETAFDPAAGELSRHITSFRLVDSGYRRDAEVHRLVLVEPAAVRTLLCGFGFEVQLLPSYGASALPEGVVAFLARKLES